MAHSVLDLLDLLARLALASTCAIVMVLLVRRPLRAFGGAAGAYLCWLAVPAALLAAALPVPTAAPVTVLALAPSLKASLLVASVAPAAIEWLTWLDWLARLWAGGALATGVLFVLGQRAFVRSLGGLTERDGIFHAASARHGPVLLGLFRPRVVVPADFTARYSLDEQALIIAHERQHAARRDPAANALLVVLQSAFWFNPLMHVAASRFRFDQELACDSAVMARHGAARQAYAAAMLKTQAAGALALATCHWQSSHPLKERIMQLKKSTSTPRRHATGLIVALLACASMLGTVSARAGGETYDIAVKFADGPGTTSAKVRVKAGEEFALRSDQPGPVWSGVFTVTPAAGDAVMVKMKVTPESGIVASPMLLLKLGRPGAVREGDAAKPTFQIGLTVTRA